MIRMKEPQVDEPATHSEIFEATRPRIRDTELVRAVFSRFEEYRTSLPALRVLTACPPVITRSKDQLYGLYTSETAAAKAIRTQVDAGKPRRCPYCGIPSTPATRDHVLPRSEFPEFSVFAINLVPVCYECNTAKKQGVWDSTGRRLFLHPYFDDFMAESFVRMRISPGPPPLGYSVPLFTFAFGSAEMNADDAKTCKSHFERLGVTRKLTEYCQGQLKALRRQYLSVGTSAEKLRNELRVRSESHAAVDGPNAWESIFIRAVMHDNQLIEHLAG